MMREAMVLLVYHHRLAMMRVKDSTLHHIQKDLNREGPFFFLGRFCGGPGAIGA